MNTDTPVDRTELAPRLVDVVRQDRTWYLTITRELVGPTDRLAVDVGCGAGMALVIARMVAADDSSRWTRTVTTSTPGIVSPARRTRSL